jgi:hypothetical protein
MIETHELVVPRSIPIILLIFISPYSKHLPARGAPRPEGLELSLVVGNPISNRSHIRWPTFSELN